AGNAGQETPPPGWKVPGSGPTDTAFHDEVGEDRAEGRGAHATSAPELGYGERRGRLGEGPRDAVLRGGERARRVGVRSPRGHAEREPVAVAREGKGDAVIDAAARCSTVSVSCSPTRR